MRKLSTILLGLVLVSLASLLALSLWLRQPIQTMTHRILFASSKALSQPYNQQVLAGLRASINPSDDIELQTLALPDNAEEQSVILSHQKLLTGDQVILHSAYSLELTPQLESWLNQGIKLTLIDSPKVQLSQASQLGWPPQEQGQALAQALNSKSVTDAPFIIAYQANNHESIERLKGAQDFLDQSGQTYQILALEDVKLDNQQAILHVVETLNSKPAVILLDQISIHGLARYLHQSLSIHDIYSIGYQAQIFSAIEAGDIKRNLTPNPYALGYAAGQTSLNQPDSAYEVATKLTYQWIEAQDLFNPQYASWLFPLD
jgi:hypothetical protein